MLPATTTLANEFDEVMRAAAAVGLAEESTRIARRAAGLQQPFMLFVMGDRHAGKSTVINELAAADIAPVDGSPQTWLNVYRRRNGRSDFAEVYWHHAPARNDVLTLDQARALTRDSAAFDASVTADIERVVWHVNASGLNRDFAIVEVPDDASTVADSCWEADAVLWVTSTQPKTDVSADAPPADGLATLRREKNPFVPAMCVVTGMDRLARTEWISRLRTVRETIGASFDQVIPFGLECDANGRPMSSTISPLRRSVNNWFASSAEDARQKTHRQFIDAMRRLVLRRMEGEMDALLKASRTFRDFSESVPARIATEIDAIRTDADRYLSLLSDSASAYGERLERSVHPMAREPFMPPIKSDVFFARLTDDLRDLSREIGVSWRPPTSSEQDTTTDVAAPHLALAPTLPAPPISALEAFERTEEIDPGLIEADRFDGGRQALLGRGPTEAAVFVPARRAADRLAASARASISNWLLVSSAAIEEAVLRTAGAAFRERFGCTTGEAPERLFSLEQHYNRLSDSEQRVPARHLVEGSFTPVELLWKSGDPTFVDAWNRAIVREFLEDALPDLGRRLREELELHRDEQEREWAYCRPKLESALKESRYRRLADLVRERKSFASLDWALALLPTSLRKPLGRPTTGLVLDEASAELLSLFLTPNETFLLPRHACAPGSPGRCAVEVLQRSVRQEAERIWNEPAEILLPETATFPRRRMIGLACLLPGMAAVGMAMAGTGVVTGAMIAALSVVGTVPFWRSIYRHLHGRLQKEYRRQADAIYREVARILDERNERLQRHTSMLVRDPSFLRDAEEEIMGLLSTERPALPSYGELSHRLRYLSRTAAAA